MIARLLADAPHLRCCVPQPIRNLLDARYLNGSARQAPELDPRMRAITGRERVKFLRDVR